MKIIKLISGAFQTNTYIVIEGREAVVIDPAGDSKKILASIAGKTAELTAILLTHGHFDHTSAAQELKEASGTQIYIHEGDAPMLSDIKKSFAAFMPELFKPCQADVLLKDGDVINVGEAHLTVMSTPGHSAGSVMYILGNTIFSGDTLFAGSVGRTDGWGGDFAVQRKSLEKIKALEGDYRILPGHGEETTLAQEKRTNAYLMEIY